MKQYLTITWFFVGWLVMVVGVLIISNHYDSLRNQRAQQTQTNILAQNRAQYLAAIDVARVFGRAPGCAEASADLITDVANEAVASKLDARIFASLVATESGCNQYATSSKGAIGLTMVMPRVWKKNFDFENKYNLLNRRDNLHVGATILADMIKQFGVAGGLRHYQGTAALSPDFDAAYPSKVEALAGRR